MYTIIELSYLAGMIDGEGHFYKPSVKNGRGVAYPQARLLFVQSVKNNGLELCEWAKERFGGGITLTNDLYRWQVTGKAAVTLAQALQPYLIVKRQQVLRILE
jgi:hypothetical protein